MKPTQVFDDRFVPRHRAAEFFAVDPVSLDNWVAEGILPPAIRITQRTVGWRMSTLRAVIDRAEKQVAK